MLRRRDPAPVHSRVSGNPEPRCQRLVLLLLGPPCAGTNRADGSVFERLQETCMSTQAISVPAPRAGFHSRFRLEHFVMGGAIVSLIVLVVLPLCSLLLG